jgi:hypothetical protein
VVFIQNSESGQVEKVTAEPNQNNIRLVEMHFDANPRLVEAGSIARKTERLNRKRKTCRHGVTLELFIIMAPPPTWTSLLLLLLLIHVQVPILAPVRQIDATPQQRPENENENDDENERDLGRGSSDD